MLIVGMTKPNLDMTKRPNIPHYPQSFYLGRGLNIYISIQGQYYVLASRTLRVYNQIQSKSVHLVVR